MKITHPKKPHSCMWISNEAWDNLKLKEKDFVIMLHEKKYSRKQIARKLYIESDVWYWKISKNVSEKLKWDINKVNKSK